MSASQAVPERRIRTLASALIVYLGALACAIGFVMYRLDLAFDPARGGDMLVLLAIVLPLALILRALRVGSFAAALGLLCLLGVAFFAGVRASFAVVVLSLAAFAIGERLLPTALPYRSTLALPVGIVVVAAVVGWLTPLPIHHRWVYLPMLLTVIAWRARILWTTILETTASLAGAAAAAPVAAAFAAIALGFALTGAWLPTMQSDDLAYHLGLPTRLLHDGYYAPDPAQQIWALAPWLGDVVQGIAQVLAGGEARGCVNTMWLLCAAAALWSLTGTLGANMRTRWLAVACLASLPTIGMLCAGMQTELPALALLFALVLSCNVSNDSAPANTCAILAGGLIGLKFGQAVAALVVLAWIVWRSRKSLTWRCGTAVALFFFAAGSSYFHAARVSGNPMLPLFNNVFLSPVMAPEQLFDARWHTSFGIDLPWAMTFATPQYLESATRGGFGFVLVALSGAWILALYLPRTRALAIVASLVLILPLVAIQYARYALPGMALLIAPMFAAGESALGARRFCWLAAAVCVLNLAFQANAGWSMNTVQRKRLVSHFGNPDVTLRLFAPERLLIAQLRERDSSDSIVLAIDPLAPYVAELGERGRNTAWYSPQLERARLQAEQDASGERWQVLIQSTRARWLLLRPDDLTPAQRAGIALSGAQRFAVAGAAELWSHESIAAAAKEAP